MSKPKIQAQWLLLMTLLVTLFMPTIGHSTLATDEVPEILIEVENPPGSGNFEPLASSIIPTITPNIRITLSQDVLGIPQINLLSTDPNIPLQDITTLFEDLATNRVGTALVSVSIGNNTIQAISGSGDVVTVELATMLNFDDTVISIGPHEILPLVPDPNAGTLVEQDTVIIIFRHGTGVVEMSQVLREQHLIPVGFNFVTDSARARITDGRLPSVVAQALRSNPLVQDASPNFAVQLPDAVGERMPNRLRNSYRENAGPNCTAGGTDLHGCFDHAGPDSTNELRIFRHHFLMDTFAGHRLVDRIVGANPAVRVAIADVDSGVGNGTNTTDIPIGTTGLYGFSRAPFTWNNVGNQIGAGALGIANVNDTSAGGHGTQVVAAAAERGTQVLGTGRHLRVRPIRYTAPPGGAGGTWQDAADGIVGACRDPNVVVVIMEIWNALTSYANLAAYNNDAPRIRGILQPAINFCRNPFIDTGRDGNPTTPDADGSQGDGMYQVGEPFSDTDSDGRFNPTRDGKILAAPMGNDGRNLGASQMPSAFVPVGVRQPANLYVFGVSSTETVNSVREPERLAGSSNFGSRVSVAAMGGGIILPNPAGNLTAISGTSFSTPLASGLVGEMIFLDRNLARAPLLNPLQIIEIMGATADDYGSSIAANNTNKPNDRPGNGRDDAFGHGRINVWKAILSVVNRGIAAESHRAGSRSPSTNFPSLATITDANTQWYGFKIHSPVLNATVWLDGVQLTDGGSTAPPGGGIITAYAGVRSDRAILLGIDDDNDGTLDEDPTSSIIPVGNSGGEYIITFSIERSDLVDADGELKTLSLRRPGQGVDDAPFSNLRLDLQKMRDGSIPGVVFDDFVFEITPTDFGDANKQGYPTPLSADGARHLNTNLEWLGQPDRPNVDSVSPEQDAGDGPTVQVSDPDGVNNIHPNVQAVDPHDDLDRFDDGVVLFPLTYKPGEQGKVEFTVCVADPGSGRYSDDPDRSLYVNGWIDWNTNGTWEIRSNEHVVNGVQINPAFTVAGRWREIVAAGAQPQTTRRSVSPSGRCATFEAEFPVPQQIGDRELWTRFRVDYGENAGRNDPRPLFQSDRSLTGTTVTLANAATRFGEVEDYLIGSDFGDAPDPYETTPGAYPTRKGSDGARHLDMTREWLGKPGTDASVTRETDGCDTTQAEQDRIPNLGGGCESADMDLKDDGAAVPAFVQPDQVVNIEIDVSAKIDAFGYTNRGPGGENSAGVQTLKSNCQLGPIPDMDDTPMQHRDRGRYAAWDPTRRLYLNVWADWNANGAWEDGELVISGPLDPEDWGADGDYTLGEPFTDNDRNRVRTAGEAFTDVAGTATRHLSCPVKIPAEVAMGKTYYWRFRLDHGENARTNNNVIHHATEDGRALNQTRGGALWGEVEDYPQRAGEVDEFPLTTAEVTIEGPFGATKVRLSGPTKIFVDIGNVADTDGDGREQVQAEMIELNLTGSSPVGPVTVRLRDSDKHPFQRSLGEIEETTNNTPGVLDVPPFTETGTADSFFDIYFEVEVLGQILHSDEPKRMESTITHKPPREPYQSPDVIVLFDENENRTRFRIGGATHVPIPEEEEEKRIQLGGGITLELQLGFPEAFPFATVIGEFPTSSDLALRTSLSVGGGLSILLDAGLKSYLGSTGNTMLYLEGGAGLSMFIAPGSTFTQPTVHGTVGFSRDLDSLLGRKSSLFVEARLMLFLRTEGTSLMITGGILVDP
ncbi:MAG: GEVED domain-containing protein [Candidatus Bipolaricaulia bacterium]